jgi:hypothetical protein
MVKHHNRCGHGAEEEICFNIEAVRKTPFGLLKRASLPKFPSIEIDGTVAFEGCNITTEQREAAIRQRRSA